MAGLHEAFTLLREFRVGSGFSHHPGVELRDCTVPKTTKLLNVMANRLN